MNYLKKFNYSKEEYEHLVFKIKDHLYELSKKDIPRSQFLEEFERKLPDTKIVLLLDKMFRELDQNSIL